MRDEVEPFERKRITKHIHTALENITNLKSALITVLNHIKKLTDCEAVAIRLHNNDGDYPYYVYDGFSKSFILHENSLCSKNSAGKRILSPDGDGYILDCMCGNVIRGRFDSSLTFFTKNGSFWTNNTSALLATTTEEERQSRTRNYCNSCGYESVALIPLKVRGERIGLLQLNDMRKGMFNEELIEYLETVVVEKIGLAAQKCLSRPTKN
ncbi:MAG: GAF domain-containing protein [Promethearchaeota archaeon]